MPWPRRRRRRRGVAPSAALCRRPGLRRQRLARLYGMPQGSYLSRLLFTHRCFPSRLLLLAVFSVAMVFQRGFCLIVLLGKGDDLSLRREASLCLSPVLPRLPPRPLCGTPEDLLWASSTVVLLSRALVLLPVVFFVSFFVSQ